MHGAWLTERRHPTRIVELLCCLLGFVIISTFRASLLFGGFSLLCFGFTFSKIVETCLHEYEEFVNEIEESINEQLQIMPTSVKHRQQMILGTILGALGGDLGTTLVP